MRKIDETRYEDAWYVTLCKDARVLFDYLICKADRAGFVKVNETIWSRDTLLSDSECLLATDSLCKPLKGTQRVFKRLQVSSGEEIVWLKNYVKVQCSKRLVVTNSWHVGVLTRLHEMVELFPEVEEAYSVYETLREASSHSKPYKIRREKRREDKISLGESENLLCAEGPAMQVAGKYWEQMKVGGAGCHQTIKVDALARLIQGSPDMDWGKMINYVIGKDLNGGVRDVYGFLGRLCMDAKWMAKGGKVVELDAKKKLLREQEKAIGQLHLDGKIDDKECERRMKELIGWTGEEK